MFGCNGKYNFSEIVFLLTRIYAFDPKMNLRSHFHFNSFPGHSPRIATQREREKRNTKVTKNTERTRAPILNPATETSDLATETSDPATESSEPKTQLPSARVNQLNPLLRSTSRRWRRVQPDDHRPDERPIQLSQSITGPATSITEPNTLSRWVFRHRFTGLISAFYIYIYLLFFYLLIFLIINVLLNVYLWVMYMKCWSFSVCRLLKIGFVFFIFLIWLVGLCVEILDQCDVVNIG